MIYFDYAAASLVRKEVLDSFIMACQDFANPNSNHVLGRKANEKIQDTTKKIADLLGVLPDEIIYTSGSTESNNLAVKGILERYKNFGKHILVSSLEHSSILSPLTYMSEKGFEIEVIPVNEEGIITPLEIEKRLRPDTIFVSVTAMDSELGIVEPIDEIGKMLKKYPHTYFHTDATQIIGKEPFSLVNVDLATISAHKLSGLDGTSILIKKENVELVPLLHGGRSTTNYRSGTPILPNIVAFYTALKLALEEQSKHHSYVLELQTYLLDYLKKKKDIVINNTSRSSVYFVNFSVLKMNANDLVSLLEEKGIIVSAKTSCCPLNTPSKLVYALTKNKRLASSSIRVSLSYLTTKEELDKLITVLESVI